MASVIRLQTVNWLNIYSIIKTKPAFKHHIMARYCIGTLTADEVEYLFVKHHLAEW